MRRALPLLLPLCLLASGCQPYPEDPLFVFGQALRADGSPMAGQPLTFERGQNPDTVLGRVSVTPEPGFAPFTQATTGADGTFLLELTHGDTEQHGFREYKGFRLRTATPPDARGHVALGSFSITRGDVELPALRPWEAGLEVVEGASGLALTFAPPPEPPASPVTATVPRGYSEEYPDGVLLLPTPPLPVLQLHGEDGLVWQQPHAPSPWALSEAVLEDFTAQAQVRAVSVGEWYFEPLGASTASNVRFRLEWRGGRVALPAGTRTALSRGAACWPERAGACPWTDGRLAPVRLGDEPPGAPRPGEPPLAEPPEFVEEAGVTLAAPARLGRAVVRGLLPVALYADALTVVLEGSEDGTTWRPLARHPVAPGQYTQQEVYITLRDLLGAWARDSPLDGPLQVDPAPLYLELPLAAGAPVRHVRLLVRDGAGARQPLLLLSELSLFE